MKKTKLSHYGMAAFAFFTIVTTAPFVSAEGLLSIGGRASEYVPTDGKGSLQGGGKVQVRLPLLFAIEASADYRKDTFGATTAKDTPVQLSLLTYFLPKIIVVQPFILAGGGWYHTNVDGPRGFTGHQDRFGPHAGAGLELTITSNLYADATYRYVWLSDLHSVDAAGNGISYRDRGHMVTVGLNYKLF